MPDSVTKKTLQTLLDSFLLLWGMPQTISSTEEAITSEEIASSVQLLVWGTPHSTKKGSKRVCNVFLVIRGQNTLIFGQFQEYQSA